MKFSIFTAEKFLCILHVQVFEMQPTSTKIMRVRDNQVVNQHSKISDHNYSVRFGVLSSTCMKKKCFAITAIQHQMCKRGFELMVACKF